MYLAVFSPSRKPRASGAGSPEEQGCSPTSRGGRRAVLKAGLLPCLTGGTYSSFNMGLQGLARPLSRGGHTGCQLTAETARRGEWVPPGSRERRWRVGPAAGSHRGPPRASRSSQGRPPAPNAIAVLSDGPAWACPRRRDAPPPPLCRPPQTRTAA